MSDISPVQNATPAPKPAAATATKPKSDESDAPKAEMSFFEHLGELRMRLTRCALAAIVGCLGCYAFSKELFDLLLKPLLKVFPPGSSLIYTSLPEAFITYLMVSLVAGLLVVSPYIFYQVWSFIAPGLYKEERIWLLPIAFFSAFFFVGGAMFGYFIVFPFAFDFFLSFATDMIKPMPSLKEYLGFSLKLLLAFGLIFELPLVIFFLARMGLVTARGLAKKRKYAVLGAFIVGAILTPPDILSQCLMAGPMIVLYELGIIVARVFGKKKPKPEEESAGPPAADADEAPATPEAP